MSEELNLTGQAEERISPKVTIIVVTYNHQSFIDDCLAGCVSQADEFPNLEIVVSDDGSSDRTPDAVKRWATEHPGIIRPILSDKNTGIAGNFTRGLAAARGELIAWLGGDDLMLPGKIRAQEQFMRDHPEATGSYHDAEVFAWPSGAVLGKFSELYAGKAARASSLDLKKMLDPRYQMLPSTMMVRRAAMPAAFDSRLRFHNDFLFDVETIARGGNFRRMEGTFVRYRKHEKSIGVDPSIRAMMLEENLIVISILEARYPEWARQINRRAIYYLTLECLRSYRDGDATRARSICCAMCARGARTRGAFLWVLGRLLASLLRPENRRLAVRLRSWFA